MRKFKIELLMLLLLVIASACDNSMKNCIKKMQEDGYSYDEAEDNCERQRAIDSARYRYPVR